MVINDETFVVLSLHATSKNMRKKLKKNFIKICLKIHVFERVKRAGHCCFQAGEQTRKKKNHNRKRKNTFLPCYLFSGLKTATSSSLYMLENMRCLDIH